MEYNLADLHESVVDVLGARTAMVAGRRRLSFDELEARANRLAHHLAAAGVRAGDAVGLQLANGTEYIEAMLACFKIRAVPVNVNYRYEADELAYLYRDAGLVGLVVHARFAPAAAAALGAMADRRAVLVVAEEGRHGESPAALAGAVDYEEALAASSPERSFGPRSSDDLYCVYTGGTTGMPKGVLWRHEDIFFAAMGGGDPLTLGDVITAPEELAGRILTPGMVALAVPPFMHASGHWLAFSTMFGGGTVVVLPGGRFDPVEVWRTVEAEAVNTVVIVGDAMARPLLDVLAADPAGFDLSSLMAVGSGGAVLSPSTKERMAELLPGRIVADRFGSSETGQVGGHQDPGDPFGAPRLRVDGTTAVLDDDLRPVEPGSGVVGHLARGGRVPLAYLGDPGKTAATFVEAGGRRWALPGDLATVEADGVIRVLGRGSVSINSGGEKVFPDEVEGVVKGHPAVADAVIVGVPDDRFGQAVCAVVALAPGADLDLEGLRGHCRGRLADYKIPRRLVVAPSVERSPSGKPDYRWAAEFAASALAGAGVGAGVGEGNGTGEPCNG